MKVLFKTNTKSIIIISSLISICLVLFIAFSANYYISRMSKNNTELYSAYRISELMKSFKNNVTILENKQRGYVVTGDGKFLEAYKLKETETKTYLKSMEKYFSGKPEEEAFYKLKELTYKKLMEAKDLKGSQGSIGIPSEATPLQDIGINTMAEINTTVEAINDSLSKTTKLLLDKSVEYVEVSKRWSYLEIGLAVMTALAAIFILIGDINSRNKLENELRIAKKQAENNTLLKEQFMANMSHEIRTPMNAILGFSDLLQKTTLNKTQLEYLLAVKTSGSNLLNIVNDILDFSKIEAGKLNIEKIAFNIIDLFTSLKTIFLPKAAEKNIDFQIQFDENTPKFIFGDPTRLSQILINLINNAIKFTNNGAVTVSCAVKSIEHDTVQFVFKIKDSGIGIASDKIETVFERFNQGNTETTRNYGGTGLGLAIVKQLVEIQNGSILLKSTEGIGSEFIITLSYPISYENKVVDENNINSQLTITSTKPIHVLLAEDNVLNQKLASTYLKAFGLDVDIAENGIEALEKLKIKSYDLILLDIQMPKLDGYSTAKKIREDLKLNIPIIAMTAHMLSNERQKCLDYGMNDYLSKPFKEIELFNIVHQYVGEKQETLKNNSEPITETKPNKTIDLEQLKQLARGNTPFLIEIIELFLEQNPLDLIELENAFQSKNSEMIRAISHKMKTSVGFMGMANALHLLSEIEELSSDNNQLINAQLIHIELKETLTHAVIELRDFLTTIKLNPINKPN